MVKVLIWFSFIFRIAVYDLGGGTFDISVLEIQKGVFEVSRHILKSEESWYIERNIFGTIFMLVVY